MPQSGTRISVPQKGAKPECRDGNSCNNRSVLHLHADNLGILVRPDSGVGEMVFVLTTSVAVLVLVERLLNSPCDRYHYRQRSLSPKR
jgi:hypothetical protein